MWMFTRSLVTGIALGALLGLIMITLAEWSDKSFRSPAEIRQRLGLAVIGHIPHIRNLPATNPDVPAELDPVLVTALRPRSTESEAYRGLRTQLYFSTQGRGHQVIQVTSPTPGDGKSTIAGNLAISIAQSGKKTVLIDCDFRKPRIHKMFAVASSDAGLASVVAGVGTIAEAVIASGVPNLDLLTCGPRPANPAELLTSPQFHDTLTKLRELYEFVIIDTPERESCSTRSRCWFRSGNPRRGGHCERVPNLDLLTCGPRPANSAELLTSRNSATHSRSSANSTSSSSSTRRRFWPSPIPRSWRRGSMAS